VAGRTEETHLNTIVIISIIVELEVVLDNLYVFTPLVAEGIGKSCLNPVIVNDMIVGGGAPEESVVSSLHLCT
jgi:hypothetical protein